MNAQLVQAFARAKSKKIHSTHPRVDGHSLEVSLGQLESIRVPPGGQQLFAQSGLGQRIVVGRIGRHEQDIGTIAVLDVYGDGEERGQAASALVGHEGAADSAGYQVLRHRVCFGASYKDNQLYEY